MENQEYPNRRHYGYGVDSFLKIIYRFTQKTSMLVTNELGGELCWWQGKDVGDGFNHFHHQHSLCHRIGSLSSRFKYRHQHQEFVTNMTDGHKHVDDNCEILSTDLVNYSKIVPILAKIIFPAEILAIVYRPLGNSF